MLPDSEEFFIYKRQLDGEEWLVVLNFTDKEMALPVLDGVEVDKLVLSNYKEQQETLSPYEARIYTLK